MDVMPRHSLHRSMILVVCLGAVVMSSCWETRERWADEAQIERATDSLAAAGDHGYYVALYLVGRFKTYRLPAHEFDVSVEQLDERLNKQRIGMHLIDTARYELSYELGSEPVHAIGEFNKALKTEGIEVMVSMRWPMTAARFETSGANDLEFAVYPY